MSCPFLNSFIQDKQANLAILIDVREPHEYSEFHVKEAVSWPLSHIEKMNFEEKAGFLRPYQNKHIYLHCRSGTRVLYAMESLKDLNLNLTRLAQSPQEIQACLD